MIAVAAGLGAAAVLGDEYADIITIGLIGLDVDKQV